MGKDVNIVHGRHSGGEALFLTPNVIRLGDENTVPPGACKQGDVLFCFEQKFICEHAKEDASEVAWIYHLPAQPRRWISKKEAEDPTNQTGPWETTDVALNKWATVVEEDNFFAASANLPRTGELRMRISAV